MPLFELFLDAGICVVVLAALSWIAYARLRSIQDEPTRYVEALSETWLLRTAVLLAVLTWIWSFGRLFFGDAYLRGSGFFQELSTLLLGLVLVILVVAWLGIRPGGRFHPWLTYGLVLALILLPGSLLLPVPEVVLSQENPAEERNAVDFVQKRLAGLKCFEAAREPKPTVVSFDAATTLAVIAFQQANGLVEPGRYQPGIVRPRVEFRRLAKPFPFLFGPKPCLK